MMHEQRTASFFFGNCSPKGYEEKLDSWLSLQGPGLKVTGAKWQCIPGRPFLQLSYIDTGLVVKNRGPRRVPNCYDPELGFPVVTNDHLRGAPCRYRARVLLHEDLDRVFDYIEMFVREVPSDRLIYVAPIEFCPGRWLSVVIYETSVIRLRMNLLRTGSLIIPSRSGATLDDWLNGPELRNLRPDVLVCQKGTQINMDVALPVLQLKAHGGLKSQLHFGSELDVRKWAESQNQHPGVSVSNPTLCVPFDFWYAISISSNDVNAISLF